MERQTALTIDELITMANDPATHQRCLYVNEIGVVFLMDEGEDKEKARKKLLEFLKDKEKSAHYPAYMYLRDGLKKSADTEIETALNLFAENPQNTDLMRMVEKRDAGQSPKN
jgi:hypothetical protein